MRIILKNNSLIICVFLVFSYAFGVTHLYAGEKDKTVYVKIFTNENLNKDVEGNASPLKIIFLQLLKKASFEQMDEGHLDDNFKEYFGSDLLEEYSLMIEPDEIQDFSLDVNPDAKYLGVIMMLRELNDDWKYLYEKQDLKLFSKKKNYLNLEISEDKLVQLNVSEAAKLTLNKQLRKLEKEGLDVSILSENSKKKLETKIKKESIPKAKASLEKGIYKKY